MHYEKSRPDRRCARRWNVIWPATLAIEGHEYPCTIVDLSEFGARIEARGLAYGPSLANLRSQRFGSLECRVQWARGVEAGIRFEAAPEAVMLVLKPVVPGLVRREKVADIPPPAAARRSFGRLSREKPARAA